MEPERESTSDSLQDEYDPARPRKGRMPAGLRRYWAAHGRGARRKKLYDPRRRRRSRRLRLDPRRRRRRSFRRLSFDPRRRSYRRRRFDPTIRGMRPMLSALLTPVAVIVGSLLHNWLSVKKGMLSGAFNLPAGGKVTHLGVLGWLSSALLGYYGTGPASDAIAHVGAGMAAEGFNLPMLENVARPEGDGAGVTPAAGPTTPYIPSEASWYR